MSDYINTIAERLDTEDPAILVWELNKAFAEWLEQSPQALDPRGRELHELLRFCKFDAIAPWLKNERGAVQRALAFAQRVEAHEVAGILEAALNGVPQPAVTFSITLPDGTEQVLDTDAGEVTKFAGLDWGSTDIALSFVMEGFDRAVVEAVISAREHLKLLPPPLEVRRRREANLRIANAQAACGSALACFRKLVSAPNPRMAAGAWEDFETRTTTGATTLPITHVTFPPAEPAAIHAARERFGPVADPLLDLYARHDGAELFQYQGEAGFHLMPMAEWADSLHHAIGWAEQVTWQEDRSEIPAYLYSAIAFGYIPGDSERWLFVTEGPHAGTVMLSDTDLIEDEPRFASLAEFFATLLGDAPRVLNAGGLVRYDIGGDQLFPIAYRGEGA